MAGSAPHLEAFLDAARYFIGIEEYGDNTFEPGSKGAEMASLAGFGQGFSWCAVFVSACAEKAGIAGTVIEKQTGAGWIQESTVLHCGGEWIEGPYMNGGVAVTPIPGDIITFGNEYYHGYGHATHVGIVEYVEDGQVHTIEGNTSDCSMRKSYPLDCSRINMYVRPNWANVGDDITKYLASAGQLIVGPLYSNKNDRHDMTLREVGYLNNNYALTDSETSIAISVINYTTALGEIYDIFAPSYLSNGEPIIDTSQLDGNVKIAMDFFLKMGFSAAGSTSIVACLQLYSGINTRYTTKNKKGKTLSGIACWGETKVKDLVARFASTWSFNLSGQLQYLLDDLCANFNGLSTILKTEELGVSSARTGAGTMLAVFNPEFNTIGNANRVKQYAEDIYGKLIITQPAVVGNINNLTDQNGKVLSSQYSVTIPSDVWQTGIIDDYTSYSCFYHKWAAGTTQRELADIWYYSGCPCDKGIATIGGYYCVAVRPKFGRCGDVLAVTLEDNITFPAIICDEKGEDAGSEWGHVKGNGISIIEWERIVTFEGKVQTEGAGATLVDGLGFDDWLRKKVVNITNYGSYL